MSWWAAPYKSLNSLTCRALCKLGSAFEASSIELVGTRPLQGVTFVNDKQEVRPVSHHANNSSTKITHGGYKIPSLLQVEAPSSWF